MDWFKIVSDFYKSGFYDIEQVKVFVVKKKISTEQFEEITGQVYIA